MQNEYKKVNKKKIINIIVSIFAILIMSLSSLFLGYVAGKYDNINNNISINDELKENRIINYDLVNDNINDLAYNLPLDYHLNGVYEIDLGDDNYYYYSLETYSYRLFYRDSGSNSIGLLITGIEFSFDYELYGLSSTASLTEDFLVDDGSSTIVIDLDSVGKNIPLNQFFQNNYKLLINTYLSFFDDTDLFIRNDINIMGGISTMYNYTFDYDSFLISHYGNENGFIYQKNNSLVLDFDNIYYSINNLYNNDYSYDLGYQDGYDSAYDYAYNLGLDVGSKNNFGNNYFKQLFNLILNAPYNIYRGMLEFEIFGINLFSLFSFIFTTGLIIFIIQLFKK